MGDLRGSVCDTVDCNGDPQLVWDFIHDITGGVQKIQSGDWLVVFII